MEFLDVLRGRRSIRTFLQKEVEWWKVAEVLDAGRYAPSTGNLQNWQFLVVNDAAMKQNLAEVCLKQFWMTNGTCIVVLSGLDMMKEYYGVRGEMLYSIQNCATAMQNMLLRAYDLGLGSCWVGAVDEDIVKRVLHIPGNLRVQAIIVIGYSDEKAEVPHRYELADLVSFEKYGEKKHDSIWPIAQHNIKEKSKKKLGNFFQLKKKQE